MKKTQKTCAICGKSFCGYSRSKYCPACAEERSAQVQQKSRHEHPRKGGPIPQADPVVQALYNAAAITQQEMDRQEKRGLSPRKCKSCGIIYWTKAGDSYLCQKCAEDKRKNGVYKNRICATCGKTFLGYPRSKYCPECQKAAKLETARRSRERKKAGTTRAIGSTDICQNCGQPYIVTSGLQRYCPDCSKYVVQDNIRQHKREYMAENREYFNAYHQAMRSQRRVCVICGKTFDSPTNTTVCSADCAEEQMRRTHTRAQVNAGRAKPVRLLGPRGPVNPQSGIPGVHYHPGTGKWELVLDKKYCGLYDTVAAAAAARDEILKNMEENDAKNN